LQNYFCQFQTLVHFGHNTLSRSEEYFENADDFIPERWISGQSTPEAQRMMSICCLPFGAGKRNCLGRRLAEQEIFIAVIKVILHDKAKI
jgi:cytochrome P450